MLETTPEPGRGVPPGREYPRGDWRAEMRYGWNAFQFLLIGLGFLGFTYLLKPG